MDKIFKTDNQCAYNVAKMVAVESQEVLLILTVDL